MAVISMLDLDASECFDRMVGVLVSIINRCRGSTPEAAACQAEVVHNMRHFVKIKGGVSHNHIKRSQSLKFEGNGQGSAGSMPGWHGHTEIMHDVYKQMMPGCTIESPDSRIALTQWLLSFVDDKKMFLSFQSDASHEHILNTSRLCLQTW